MCNDIDTEKGNRKQNEMKTTKRLKGNQINWNQIFYFSEVAAAGSIKDAAVKLELSPSTLSEHMAQLERDLQVTLFHRQHRKLALTQEGNRLFLRAKEMFEAGQRLIDVVSPVPLGCYPVSIGLVPCPSLQLAYKLIGDYVEDRGVLDMKLFHARYSELEQGLIKAQFDFGFTDRVPERKDIVYHTVSSSMIKFYVSSELADEPFSKLLESLPLLICNAEPEARTLAEQSLIDADLPPAAVITADYPSVLLELCERGSGIGVFSETTAQQNGKLHSLRAPKDAPKIQDNLYVVWARDGENSEAVRHLKQYIK